MGVSRPWMSRSDLCICWWTMTPSSWPMPLLLPLARRQNTLGSSASSDLWGAGWATCDGAFFGDQGVAVVGGGDAAMEEALFLTRFATRVYVIHRRNALRASQIMQERALAHPQITFVWHTVVEEVLGDEAVE